MFVAELLQMMDRVPLTLEEEEESMSAFVQSEKTRRLDINPELDEEDLDNELRIQWPALDIATKRHFLSNKLKVLNLEATYKVCSKASLVLFYT